MGLPINVNELLKQEIVESARIEYKRDWNPEPILHSICAFANDIDNWGGGYIVIGVDEKNGMPVFPVSGLDKKSIDKINKEILQKCNLIEPRYIPVVENAVIDGKNILVLWCYGGEERPYKCPARFPNDKTSRTIYSYFIRKASNTIKANKNDEQELFDIARRVPFDDSVNYHAELSDLKTSLISEFLNSVQSNLYEDSLSRPLIETANAMRIVGGAVEAVKPLNVGLMFFNERPSSFFPYARIEVVDKPDPTGEGMTEKIFEGPLDRQLRDALQYIKNYVIQEKVVKLPNQAEAVRIFNYPFAAIEEALTNAVYHKSYQIREPITVMIVPEKMEITSLPGPDRTITDDDLKNCQLISKRYRNRRIGDFLKELKLVEGRNTGIPTMLRAMRNNGSRPPVFETDEARDYFTVTFFVHESFISKKANSKINEEPEKIKSGKRRTYEEIKKLVYDTLKTKGEMSGVQLATTLGYAGPTHALKLAISELISEEKVEYTEKEKSKSSKQKLRAIKR